MWKTPTTLVGIVLVLLALGIVMLASASTVKGEAAHYDAQYFLKRQLAWLAVAVIAGVLAASFDYHWWQRRRVVLALVGVAVLLLGLVFVPGVGVRAGGSCRWVRLGPLRFQPSELAKFATVVGLAAWLTRVGGKASRFSEGILKPMLPLGVILALVLKEPDYGTTMLVAAVAMALLFVGGSRLEHVALVATAGMAVLAVGILHDPVRMGRILSFLMPDKYPDAYYQLGQSKDAFTLGGIGGVGLGESLQKHFYLPEAHTDFILAIVGEELGIVATCLVVTLFLGYLLCGTAISLKAPDLFGRLLGFGITLITTGQAAINVGVVTGCLPTKGLPLPFISYGGSSLIMSLVGVGVLVNIARHVTTEDSDAHTRAIKDRTHWL
jgi:cell division protein FtsW